MGKYKGSVGREIIERAKTDILRAGTEMSLMAEYGQYPNEYRAQVRRDKQQDIRVAKSDAEADFEEWAKSAGIDATRRLNAPKLGTAAEEARKVQEELRISRMVSGARASRTEKSTAADLAAQSMKVYGLGNDDEAMVLARAASELGDRELSAEVIEMVTTTRTLADPDRAKATKELLDIEVLRAALTRDVSAAMATAYQDGQKLARALGDQHAETEMRRDASEARRTSTIAAVEAATKAGVAFSAPVGDGSTTPEEMYALERGANPKISRQDEFEHALDSSKEGVA